MGNIESATKHKLSAEQQDRLVASIFGPDIAIAGRRELTGGYFNSAYELVLSDGTCTILKVAPLAEAEILSYEHDIMAAEVQALQLMQAAGTVPVPRVYGYDGSRSLIFGDYFFMERIAGEPYSDIKEQLPPETRAAVEEELGRYNRLINEVRGERFGLFRAARHPLDGSWRETFGAILFRLLEDGERLWAELPVPAERLRTEIHKLLPALEAVKEPRLVHWDLWNGNVFVKDGVITGLIDWERALWGDPLLEYYFRYVEDNKHFLRGYGEEFVSPNEQARIKLYDLYLDLIFFIEGYSRKYGEEHRKWAGGNLLEGWKRCTGSEYSPERPGGPASGCGRDVEC
ncbi:phosphotransferase family protein [Paenibacillus tepidiphilus]|uniref:phosphotransferase family protein n=1 Tax=Paenibacillus tepidiphilus TaxID=2608683 RepID=UPI001EF06625|nr:aminoglycoside phosphotransferase family protein [Paenibacillus tepidiphilus]